MPLNKRRIAPHRYKNPRLKIRPVTAAMDAATDYPHLSQMGKVIADVLIPAMQQVRRTLPQVTGQMLRFLPGLFLLMSMHFATAAPVDDSTATAPSSTAAASLWPWIAGNAALNLLAFIPSVVAHYRKHKDTSHPALKGLATYGENWLTPGIAINFFRDFLWALLSSTQINKDPYNPFLISLEDNLKICAATVGFGLLILGGKRLHDKKWAAAPNISKAIAGAMLGLLAWNIPAWAALALNANSTFPESYAIAPLMGLCEGLTQMLCTAFPERNKKAMGEFVLNYLTAGWEAGAAWQVSAVSQGLYQKAGIAPSVIGSLNLAATVGAFNAASSAITAEQLPLKAFQNATTFFGSAKKTDSNETTALLTN